MPRPGGGDGRVAAPDTSKARATSTSSVQLSKARTGAASANAPAGGVSPAASAEGTRGSVAASAGKVAGAADAIRAANRELAERTADQLSLAIAVVAEQRDAALTKLATLAAEEKASRERLAVEHDQFVAFLMEEQDGKVEQLERQLKEAEQALGRQRALVTAGGQVGTSVAPRAADAEQLAEVRRLLEVAYGELDETKALVGRLEEERDAALGAADDVRVELYSQLEGTRDEQVNLQNQLDDLGRLLEEERDRSRDDAFSLNTQLEEAQRELDERRGEVLRLRSRLDTLEEVQHSRPPPPMVGEELQRSRQEAQALRKELIDTKRQLSRVTREFEILRNLRARAVQQHAGAPGPRAGALQPEPVLQVGVSQASEAEEEEKSEVRAGLPPVAPRTALDDQGRALADGIAEASAFARPIAGVAQDAITAPLDLRAILPQEPVVETGLEAAALDQPEQSDTSSMPEATEGAVSPEPAAPAIPSPVFTPAAHGAFAATLPVASPAVAAPGSVPSRALSVPPPLPAVVPVAPGFEAIASIYVPGAPLPAPSQEAVSPAPAPGLTLEPDMPLTMPSGQVAHAIAEELPLAPAGSDVGVDGELR